MEPSLNEIPLFPLRVVLFPGMPLPLQILEERYKLMVRECVEQARPFGVVLTRSGTEPAMTADPCLVGTSAIITQVTRLPDDRLSIVSLGYQRFQIQTLFHDRPFLMGMVRIIPLLGEETEEARNQATLLRPRLQQYVELLARMTEMTLELAQVPEKPALLAFLAAILLQVPLEDKQILLATPGIPEMLALENRFLLRERWLLRSNVGMEYSLAEAAPPFAMN